MDYSTTSMNYKLAFDILEIDMSEKKYSDINLECLKKQYHKLALQNQGLVSSIHLYRGL